MKDKEEGKDTSSDVEVKYKNIIWETWLSLALFILFLINEFGFLFVNSIDHERSISNMAFSWIIMVSGIAFSFSGFRQGGQINKAFSGFILLGFISVIALLSIH